MDGFFFIIWGLFFGGAPAGAVVWHLINGRFDFSMIAILPFCIIGITASCFGFKKLKKAMQLKSTLKSGADGYGYFVDMEVNPKHGLKSSTKVKFYFINSSGNKVDITTDYDYTYEEAKYFKNIQKFKIKYKDNFAAITEIPDVNAVFTLNADDQPFDENSQEYMFKCEYCGAVQEKTGKCSNCGAQITRHNKNSN
ncbi:MAG: hypothetical protein IJD48_00995 [Clostridia bacterium]|nr:hypothetical protein [Clostridia bacterium]